MGKLSNNQKGFSAVETILFIIILTMLGFIGWYVWHNKAPKVAPASSTPAIAKTITPTTTQPAKPTDPYAGWKTYTSSTEKATFMYPSDWSLAKPSFQPNSDKADSTGIKSPSGEVLVSWLSAADGFGGYCDDTATLGTVGACPLITIVGKTDIAKAPGLDLVTAIVTSDNKNFQPWIGVLDSSSNLTTHRGTDYDLFQGKHNSSVTGGNNTTAIFSTGNATMTGPNLSQSDANAWFNKSEAQQAKLILASLTY